MLQIFGLEFFNYAPPECLNKKATFYTRLWLQTVCPVGLLPLIWAAAFKMRDKKNKSKDWRATAIHFSLLFIELILTSVSKTIFQTFGCTSFDHGDYLDEQLTLPCDDSSERQWWVSYAGFCVLIYPIGVPALMMTVLVYNRAQIKTVMLRVQAQSLRAGAPCELKEVLRDDERNLRSIARLFEKFVSAFVCQASVIRNE